MNSPGVGATGVTADPAVNVADLLRGVAARHPDRPAVIASAGSRTWGELDAAVDVGVAALAGLGMSPGERVVIALPTGADLALALFTAARAGLIAVPIGPSRGDVGTFADRVGAIAAISDQHDHGLPIGIDSARLAGWWTARDEPAAGSRPPAVGGGEDLALLARVRGDRAVMLSHRAILAAVSAIAELGQFRMRDHDRVLQVLPMYHLAGWVVAFLPLTLIGGASVVPDIGFDSASVGSRPDAHPAPAGPSIVGVHGGSAQGGDAAAAGRRATESALTAAHDHRVTLIPGAPGFYHHLATIKGAERSLSSVRLLTSGTAPLEPEDFAVVRALLGQPVWEGYGLSESASVVTSTLSTTKPHRGSVGRPLPGLELRVIGPDGHDVGSTVGPVRAEDVLDDDTYDLAEVPDAGEVGRIAIRGATLFSGYWPDGGGGPGPDGWYVTGDIGYLDDAGELHLVDRAAEVIKVAGFTVYPREVEEVLATHPYVAEVAVIGLRDARGQEQVAAVLVARTGKHPTPGDLTDFVSERLPPFKRPVVFHLVEGLPRTEVGRLDRAAVQRRFVSESENRRRLNAVAADDPTDTVARSNDESTDQESAAVDADLAPEQVGELAELGVRLPGTGGDRSARGQQDSDADLF
ncbi:MAG: AMP-binding protein [Nakamurella sp.]